MCYNPAVMAGDTHPYLKAVYSAAVIFFALIAMIIFIALYVHSKSIENPEVSAATVEQNLTPPGKIYPRP